MKIFRIFLTCFSILYFVAYIVANICLDRNTPYQSIYWLIGELGGMLILFIGWAIVRIKLDDKTWYSNLIYICFLLIFFGYYGYKGINKYKRNIRQDKYGWAFNKNRRMLGVPEIPANWHISSRGDISVDWECKKGDSIGHVSKYISVDSLNKIKFEVDEYNFKMVKGFSPHLSIHTSYSHEKKLAVDSIIYSYESVDNQYKNISRQRADSLFSVEKIEKDY